MIIHAAVLIAMGAAGFVFGGSLGAVAVVVASTVALVAYWRLKARNARSLPVAAEQPQPSDDADIDAVMNRLSHIALQRRWNFDKHRDIARMACENRRATIDELERRYDRELRAALEEGRRDAPDGPNNDHSP